MTSNAIFKSFCKLHNEIKQYAEKLNVDKGNVVSLSVLLYYIHLSISEEQGLFAATNRRESYIKDIYSISQTDSKDIKKVIDNIGGEKSLVFLNTISMWGISKSNYESLFRIIFEKYLTKTDTASYYTDDLTTTYIVEGTVVGFLHSLFDKECIVNHVLSLNDLSKFISTLDDKEITLMKYHVATIKLIDPTCGTGSFVIKAIDILCNIYKLLGMPLGASDIQHIIKNNVFGVDIDEETLEILRYRLFSTALYEFSVKLTKKDLKNFKLGNTICDDTFLWEKEFGMVLKNGGFDCVVGNPPYKEYTVAKLNYSLPEYFKTVPVGNLYAPVIERSICNLVSSRGTIGFIVPISIVSTLRMEPLRNLLQDKFTELFFINFADRPCSLFLGVHQKLTVIIGTRNRSNQSVFVSKYKHWYKDEWNELYKNIQFVQLDKDALSGKPKFCSELSKSISDKVINNSQISLLENVCANGEYAAWLNQRATFWCKCFTHAMKSNEYKKYTFSKEDDVCLFSAILNSSLFYYIWEIYSDCWHITKKELDLIHLDFSLVDSKAKKRIVKLYKQLEEELENSKKYIGSVQTDYVYQHKLHKTTIDKIDILIGRLFDLNDDEINEIINYQLAYRLNTERK